MQDFWGEIKGAFGNLSGTFTFGGDTTHGQITVNRDGSRFWLFVVIALFVGYVLGQRGGR